MNWLARSQVMAKQSRWTASAALELVDLTTTVAVPDDAAIDPPRPEPFESFYRREFPRLVALAHALAGAAQAADIAQESMIVAYRRWDEVRCFTSPTGWVRGVCAHKADSLIRRLGAEARAVARLRMRSAPPPEPDATGDDAFWRAVRELPRRQAQVAALHYALDMSVADVATTLDCAEGTVKAHLFRARAAIADQLERDERHDEEGGS